MAREYPWASTDDTYARPTVWKLLTVGHHICVYFLDYIWAVNVGDTLPKGANMKIKLEAW